ncbi:MAG: tryptophan-rich sensory protein [Leucobacter sp.]|nr:tryptophan-rich sensory protein [Leucobacter sp.]
MQSNNQHETNGPGGDVGGTADDSGALTPHTTAGSRPPATDYGADLQDAVTTHSSPAESSKTLARGATDPHRQRPALARQVVVLVALLITVAAIAVSGSRSTMQHTEGWYQDVEKVPWSPPNAVFGPAWSLLYVLIAVAGFLIWRSGHIGVGHANRARGTLWLYVVQLLLNFAWTPVFFSGYPMFGEVAWWAALAIMLVLIVTVIWLIAAATRWSKTAAVLLVPYLGWLIFASTLNAGIVALN